MRYLAATHLSLAAAQAQAAVSYLKCDVQTVLHKPAPHSTDITHVENRYTKYFKLDDQARMVGLFNERRNTYTPVCSEKNQACQKSWNGQDISLDARGAAHQQGRAGQDTCRLLWQHDVGLQRRWPLVPHVVPRSQRTGVHQRRSGMSSEHEPHQWYFGKDSTGYRICRDPIPAVGR